MKTQNKCSFKFPNGTLFVYGTDLSRYLPYFYYNPEIKSAEDICNYASTHKLSVLFIPDFNIKGFSEFLRVKRLMKKYSVSGSRKELLKMK